MFHQLQEYKEVMVDTQSYIFDFTRTNRFMRDINREGCFDTEDMDGISKNFRFVIATSCPNNISDCLDEDYTLNLDEVILYNMDSNEGEVSLLCTDGVNGDMTISIAQGDVSFELGDEDILMAALFLVSETGYVMAYSILNSPVGVTNQVVLPVNGVIWNIINEV